MTQIQTVFNADALARIRVGVFGLAGLVCASYSVLAIAGDTPNPMQPWLPIVAGVAAAIVLWLSAFAAGQHNADRAFDELYHLEWSKAVRFSYWFAVALYPIFGAFLALGWVSGSTAFAAMGTATGAAPLLSFCIITLRG